MALSLIFSGVSLMVCGFFFVYFRAYLRRRTSSEQLLAEFREEVYKLIAEIDAATDKDALLVEERIKTLRTLLADVDKRISILARELDRRRSQEEAFAELGRRRVTTAGTGAGVAAEGVSAMHPAAVAYHEGEAPPRNKEREPGGPRFVVAAREIEPKALPFAERVVELSRAGLSSSLIAARLGVSISEVELAIAISEGHS
ncbi:MAG: hypothetical protein LBT14_06745 [Treponema sp.]|jgi:hypothetical protein|nr:hypothetical protein [Treponema sp.]